MRLTLLGRTLLLVPILALAGPLSALADRPLPEFRAHYVLHKGSFKIGEAQVRLEQRGRRYIYSSTTEPAGLIALFRDDRITERSTWTWWKRKRIRPLEYRYTHEGSKKNRDAHLIFQWDRNRVSNTVQGHTWYMQIPDGTLDKFSVHLAVMLDLQKGEEQMEYHIADGGKLKTYRFRTLGRERVETPAGTFDTVKLMRVREDMDRETYIWCAPKLNYLLVRMEHIEEDGGRFSMTLRDLPAFPRPAAHRR